MTNRFAPYPSVSRPTRMEMQCGSFSQDPDQDALLLGTRFIGLFGAVDSVRDMGFMPGAMPADLAARANDELAERLKTNAQLYDQKTQEYLQTTVHPKYVPGGGIRNLIAKTFSMTDARGSAVLGLGHLTGDKLDYCLLGNITLYLFRRTCYKGVRLVDCISGHIRGGVPDQCYMPSSSWQSFTYVEETFAPAVFNKIKPLMPDDTIIFAGHGVTNNVGDARVTQMVTEAFEKNQSPDELSRALVACAAANSISSQSGTPSNLTCAVGYMCPLS